MSDDRPVRSPRTPLIRGVDPGKALAALRLRELNYDRAEVRRPEWNFDLHRTDLAAEPPGPPMPGGAWETARELVRDYEFTPPGLVHAAYSRSAPLLGRDMLLEGRFAVLRFLMGVRITSLVDEVDDTQHSWGWGYETLQGHLERGEVVYRVIKHRDSGRVEFTATVHSQADPTLGPVYKAGWALFGRRNQLKFYRMIGQRLRTLIAGRLTGESTDIAVAPAAKPTERSDLVWVPSGARPHAMDRFALHVCDPAWRRLGC